MKRLGEFSPLTVRLVLLFLNVLARGSDGRKPFHKEEEESLLKELRKKSVWPCFLGDSNIGVNGFRAVGYHEKLNSLGREEAGKSLEETTRSKFLSSYEVFVQFSSAEASNGECKILSKECYDTWVKTRRNGVQNAEHSFRKALIAHCKRFNALVYFCLVCGRDGRRPFPVHLERKIVKQIRKKETWPCFIHRSEPHVVNIGKKGFRHLGFHEAQEVPASASAASTVATSKPRKRKTPNLTISERNSASSLSLPTVPKFTQADTCFCHDTLRGEFNFNAWLSSKTFGPTRPSELPVWDSNILTKRPKRALPSFYLNNLDEDKNINNILCYDAVLDEVSHFDSSFNPIQYQQRTSPVWEVFSPLQSISPVLESAIPSNTSAIISILETFEDVSHEEVVLVLKLRALVEPLYVKYYGDLGQLVNSETVPKDVGGDVKLLRTLRICNYDLAEAANEVELFLEWRSRMNIEMIRDDLIRKNLSFAKLREELSIGKQGGCYPFFSQDLNGDVTDIMVLKRQKDDTLEEMNEDLQSYARLCEFRSLVLDRLSYVKRRVVCFKVIYDWTAIRENDESEESSWGIGWWKAIKKWESFLRQITEMYVRWYGASCSRCHIFGTGRLFQVFTTLAAEKVFGILVGEQKVSFTTEYELLLRSCLGDQQNWPSFLEGGEIDPNETLLSKIKLSGFTRDLSS